MENSKILWSLVLEVDHRVKISSFPFFGSRSSGRKHFAPSVQRSVTTLVISLSSLCSYLSLSSSVPEPLSGPTQLQPRATAAPQWAPLLAARARAQVTRGHLRDGREAVARVPVERRASGGRHTARLSGAGGGGRGAAARPTRENNLAKETRTVKCAFLSPVPHQCPVDTRVQFR